MKIVHKRKVKDLKIINKYYYSNNLRGSDKDYYTVYLDFCRNDYAKSKKTRLYNEYGGEYCSLLEVLHSLYKDHQAV